MRIFRNSSFPVPMLFSSFESLVQVVRTIKKGAGNECYKDAQDYEGALNSKLFMLIDYNLSSRVFKSFTLGPSQPLDDAAGIEGI